MIVFKNTEFDLFSYFNSIIILIMISRSISLLRQLSSRQISLLSVNASEEVKPTGKTYRMPEKKEIM